MKLFFALVSTGIFVSALGQEVRPLVFQEVFNIVRTNLTDISEEELSRAAATGLIRELGTKVQWVTNNASTPELPDEVIGRRAIYEDAYGYVQIRSVDDRFPSEFQKWIESATNSIRGIILDLRYARGDDYRSAARFADLFVPGGEPLLKMGKSEVRSTDETKPITLPVAVLVNKETIGAAEAIAALVRETGAGLVIGATTAGEARLFETFTLSSGQQLKIGTVPIEVGDGKVIPSKGVSPDIAVTVNPAAERIFYRDPFRAISPNGPFGGSSTNEVAGGTNRMRRFNEAELVRRHRTGASLDDPELPVEAPNEPIINDPVLARGLDFLKGISALQQHRPQ